MKLSRSWWHLCLASSLGAGLLAGCGGGTDTASNDPNGSSGLPVMSIPGKSTNADSKSAAKPESASDDDEDDDEDDDAEDADDKAQIEIPKEGTVERLVHDATKLLLEAPPETKDVAALKKYRKEKYEKVVKLSQEAIKKTHKDKEKERLFNLSVHNMMEARTQLALDGDKESVDSLNEDAVALFKRNPKSQAALEGAYAQVNLAYGMAKAAPADDLKWLMEFSRAAQHFAVNYPSEDRRSLPLLFAAGLSCELADQTKEAIKCYSLIRKDFPNSTFAARVTPILKRLKLVGNPPRIAGPTLSGSSFAIDDLLGKIVVVTIWSSDNEAFVEQLPSLQKTLRKHAKHGVEAIGINLDVDDGAARKFTVDHKIAWPQVFYQEPEKRGFNHPVVLHYGVLDIPAYWLIDRDGNVVSTTVKLEALGGEIDKLLSNDGEKQEN